MGNVKTRIEVKKTAKERKKLDVMHSQPIIQLI